MTAVINGESISHEITQKQYDKFMAVDDYHRMKLFSHIFDEVDMKNAPGHGKNIGAMIGGALLAGLTVMLRLCSLSTIMHLVRTSISKEVWIHHRILHQEHLMPDLMQLSMESA